MANGDTPQYTPQEFAAKIKAKYPIYASMPDDELVTKITTKYPQYKTQIKAGVQQSKPMQAPQGPMTMGPQKGMQETGLPFQGFTPQEAKEHPIKAKIGEITKGISEFGNVAGQTALALTGPEEAAGVASKIPSAERAGAKIAAVEKAAVNTPVATHGVTDIVNRAMDMDSHGHNAPKAIKDLHKILNSNQNVIAGGGQMKTTAALEFKTARDFYSAITKLTPDEVTKTTGAMKYQVIQLAKELGERITEAARQTGNDKLYKEAIKEYRQASQIAKGVDYAMKAFLGGAIGAAGYKVVKELGSLL